MKLYKCGVCGFTREQGEGSCPKCGAPIDKFTMLSEEEVKKIYMSDRTNDIHMEIVGLAMEIIKLAKEGIEIDLDPGCVSDFKKAVDEAWIIKQRAKAEMATHQSRGKW